MYIIYYDSGTTNTRAYLLQNNRLIGKRQFSIGSKDTAGPDGRSFLLHRLYQLYQELLAEFALTDEQISCIYMSGMISSPNGIVEVPHLPTPVNAVILKNSLVSFYEQSVFRRNILIIPGIKTIQPGQNVTFSNIELVNNMRGEEIELLGIVSSLKQDTPAPQAIILPGSHTQIAFMDQHSICDILSTITGELFYAITKDTLIGSSLDATQGWELDKAMVQEGYRCLRTYGFNRAVYLVRTMDLFLNSTPSQRISYMEGVLTGGVMDAIHHRLQAPGNRVLYLGITGDSVYYDIFDAITGRFFPDYMMIHLTPDDDIPYSVKGLMTLLQQSDMI